MYDGQCPACSWYAGFVRLSKAAGTVALVDLREQAELVAAMRAKGIDPNEGMIVEVDGNLYHGPDAVNVIALISSAYDLANRINLEIFRRRAVAKMLYPLLRPGRSTLLKVLGRSAIA
jgi:predicted DCC family thiol-disulfide oxidoreductase YuxK